MGPWLGRAKGNPRHWGLLDFSRLNGDWLRAGPRQTFTHLSSFPGLQEYRLESWCSFRAERNSVGELIYAQIPRKA